MYPAWAESVLQNGEYMPSCCGSVCPSCPYNVGPKRRDVKAGGVLHPDPSRAKDFPTLRFYPIRDALQPLLGGLKPLARTWKPRP